MFLVAEDMSNICPICSGKAEIKNITLNNVLGKPRQLMICNSCKHAFVENMPEDSEINTFYRNSTFENTDNYQKIFRKETKHIKKEFSNHIKDAENILEIGPGSLGITPLLNKNQKYSIVEKSVSNVKNIQNLFGQNNSALCVYDDISEIPDDTKFDLVICLEVIEHLNNPKQYMTLVHEHLKKGATCIFSVPNRNLEIPSIDFDNFKVDTAIGHLQFYSIDSLKKLFSDFDIIQINSQKNFYEKNLYKLSTLYSVFYNNNKMIKSTRVNIKIFGLLFVDIIHKLMHPNREFNNYRRYLVAKRK